MPRDDSMNKGTLLYAILLLNKYLIEPLFRSLMLFMCSIYFIIKKKTAEFVSK